VALRQGTLNTAAISLNGYGRYCPVGGVLFQHRAATAGTPLSGTAMKGHGPIRIQADGLEGQGIYLLGWKAIHCFSQQHGVEINDGMHSDRATVEAQLCRATSLPAIAAHSA
jgi:hypothetical protein